MGAGKKVAVGLGLVGAALGIGYLATRGASGTPPPPPPNAPVLTEGGSKGPIDATTKEELKFEASGLTPGDEVTLYRHPTVATISGATSAGLQKVSAAGTATYYHEVTETAKGTQYFAVKDPTNGLSNWVEVEVA